MDPLIFYPRAAGKSALWMEMIRAGRIASGFVPVERTHAVGEAFSRRLDERYGAIARGEFPHPFPIDEAHFTQLGKAWLGYIHIAGMYPMGALLPHHFGILSAAWERGAELGRRLGKTRLQQSLLRYSLESDWEYGYPEFVTYSDAIVRNRRLATWPKQLWTQMGLRTPKIKPTLITAPFTPPIYTRTRMKELGFVKPDLAASFNSAFAKALEAMQGAK